MSVKIVNDKDAIAIVKKVQVAAASNKAQGTPPQAKKKNFFDVFGTAGCQLNCQDERMLGQIFPDNKTNSGANTTSKKKTARSARRNHFSRYLESWQEWFTAGEITASGAQGCGSCRILNQILQNLFSGNQHGLSDQYQYSLTWTFELRRRPIAQQDSVETIQLFQPPGMWSNWGQVKKN